MTAKEAKSILQKYMNNRDTTFEDDNGKEVTGWKYIIGEQVTKMFSAFDETPLPLDEGSFGFIVYLIPPNMSIKDICMMDDDEKDKYSNLWCVSASGEPYLPEA